MAKLTLEEELRRDLGLRVVSDDRKGRCPWRTTSLGHEVCVETGARYRKPSKLPPEPNTRYDPDENPYGDIDTYYGDD